ncbi:MAG: biotin--acetyl-CoA-carboxylase ligase [Gammaproteobacteria bacterium]|nr:MAG: biotin--acetyl-CoA-carboxylase ligase [Gammaproteobacteria bacterium]
MSIALTLFIIIPIIEIYFFIFVGELIGVWPTIAMIILTAIIGVSLLKQQGLSVIKKFQNKLQQGKIPTAELADGIFLIISAALLLTPGFFTDSIGFLLLIPFIREFIAEFGLALFIDFSVSGDKKSDTIIDGEFYEINNDDKKIK